MLTKLLLLLFVPSRWTIIKEEEISFKERPANSLWEWFDRRGIRYTLQNQYGDIKFKTIMTSGETR